MSGFGSRASLAIAIRAVASGLKIVVSDGERGGDVVVAAAIVTADDVNFMATYARGLVSLGLPAERVDRLRLRPMATRWGESPSAATRSIEARHGIGTGISAADRAHTIRVAASPDAAASDLTSPGHVFPIRAVPAHGGSRPGRVEAAVALAQRAGHPTGAALCTILDDDGEVARGEALERFAFVHRLPIVRTDEVFAELRHGSDLPFETEVVGWL